MLVGQTSPAVALCEVELAISRSGAGAIGIEARDPPADVAIPSGRSVGTNAERWTVSAYPVTLLLTTVTRSEIGVGVLPETTLPKLTLDRSSEIDRTGWTSTSTAAIIDTLGVEPAEHEADGERAWRGAGACAAAP